MKLESDITSLFSNPIAQFLANLLTAIVTALLTVRLSIARFRTERAWEKKLETYVGVADARNSMLHAIRIWKRSCQEGIEIPDERDAHLSAQYETARKNFSDALASAMIVASPPTLRTIEIIEETLESSSEQEDYFSSLLQLENAMHKPFSDFISSAKAELNIK